jgi:16S rRNA (cytosine1402-N4)-methyltransferase
VRSFVGRSDAKVSGVLMDLGVSSPQLDRAERGFSYRESGPLDMRMNPSGSRTAADIVNGYSTGELTRLFLSSGEGRIASRIARAIVAARPITDTEALAEIVAAAVPAAVRRRGHPARRVFQALRMEVNSELPVLESAFDGVGEVMGPDARCCVLSYHSGEDKVVKARFGEWATGGCQCPPGLPCACGAVPVARLLNRRARRASTEEVERNPRSKAARLRAVEWIGAGEVR